MGTVRKAEKVQGEWETARSSIGPSTFVGVGAGQSDAELGGHLVKVQRDARLRENLELDERKSVRPITQPPSPPIPPQCASSSTLQSCSDSGNNVTTTGDDQPGLAIAQLLVINNPTSIWAPPMQLETTLTTKDAKNRCVPQHLLRFSILLSQPRHGSSPSWAH
jgi:hypothetical protein